AMTQRHLAGARIYAQGLSGAPRFGDPAEAARAFGAHQGQDVAGVMASLALRTGGEVDAVLGAFDRGEVVRGYPMRGTVFAVAAESLAWLTQLCAAAPLRAAIARRGRLELEEHHLQRAREVLEESAAEQSVPGTGRGVLRKDLMAAWEAAGIRTDRGRGYHLLVEMSTSAAAAELAPHDLTSHDPAGERDLAWWSKLPLGTIRAVLPQIEDQLESGYADRHGRLHATADAARGGDGERLWWRPGLLEEYADAEKETMRELLLPGFDELVLGYRDRLYLMDEERHRALVPGNNGVFKRAALRRGEVVGVWSRRGAAGKRT